MNSSKITEQKNTSEDEGHVPHHSVEIDDIIGRVPSSVTRWGIATVFIVLLSLLSISWFIKFPDLLPAKVTVTSIPPPISLFAKAGGNLVLLKHNNDTIQTGDLIGFIKSNATPKSVISLELELLKNDSLMNLTSLDQLGDLLIHYNTMTNALVALRHFETNRLYEVQINQLNRQLSTYSKLDQALREQQKLATLQLTLAGKQFKADSLLFNQKVLSVLDYNKSQTEWLQQQRNLTAMKTSLINNEVQYNLIAKQVLDLKIEEREQYQNLKLALDQARQILLSEIQKWKETHLFIAPMEGTLSYLGFLENEQYIEASKPYFSIVPSIGSMVGQAELPLIGSGKVKIGQKVNIKLDNFPFEQFGHIEGQISHISLVPLLDKYYITISLPNQLLTSQNKQLPFKHILTGRTEIITEDTRLLERFVFQLRKALQTI